MTAEPSTPPAFKVAPNFITEVIERDLQAGKYPQIVTRFPPEPNGYLHLGHVFASYLDFQTALDFGGRYHLRLDDTNPEGESMEYAEAIQDDLRWLGWNWGEHLYFASDHFERYYQYAEQLIRQGDAYVDSVSGDEMARLRGSATEAGTPSRYRDRTVEENLDLFRRMRAGEFPDGAHVLRAKIDLSNPNMKLRDPVLYRILRAEHYRQGNDWCIYPMYDFQHPLQDAMEGVTHSMCSLEFVDNRAIYDWLMERLGFQPRPHQYEFGRRNLEYTVVSKRKLRRLVQEGHVSGWDDPRMPTLRAQRRLGVTPEAIRTFAHQIGVNRTNRTVDIAVLENAIRDDLNHRAPRVMAVLEPLRVVIENLPEPRTLSLPYWPRDVVEASPDGRVALPTGERVPPEQAVRDVPLTRELYIERSDFEVEPPAGFKRLTPGGRVRLRGAGIIQAERFDTDDAGQVTAVYATLQPEDAKASGVIHWVSAEQAVPAEFRLYDRLFRVPNPEGGPAEAEYDPEEPGHEGQPEPASTDFLHYLNPDSLRITRGYVEPSIQADPPGTRYQFERQGYFWPDPVLSRPEALVFGRIITLRDAWAQREGGERATTRRPEKGQKAESKGERAAAPTLTAEQAAEVARLTQLGVGEGDAVTAARDPQLVQYLQGLHGESAGTVAGWAVNDLGPAIREGRALPTLEQLGQLAELLQSGSISTRIAKEALMEALGTGEAPAEVVARKGLRQVSDTAELERLIQGVLDSNPDKVAAYRAGKTGLMGFFTGQVMRASGGQANPQRVAELLTAALQG
ncbi:glutamine--tRNA ligase/YqeY domain fusion protein [Deinococcus sonorensis]|uniref:Glutamine--tRNA ligase n=2 Tax=Deinococcus sonorensis TaxID=309891 RepID=A0AAU7UBH5_9DEIO